MRPISTLSLCVLLVLPASLAAISPAPKPPVQKPSVQRPPVQRPVVVELFQSQGCSSCPPADAVLNTLATRMDVIALNFAVTYWDQLGWKDTFAKPAYTDRQWDYARAAGRGNVATPQMIIGGRIAVLGSRPAEVDAAIGRVSRLVTGPTLTVSGDKVTVSAGKATGPATLWLVRYDPRTIQVAIRAGENGGRTIPHRNIVRNLTAIGSWNGITKNFALPNPVPGQATAILLQSGKGGPIISSTRA